MNTPRERMHLPGMKPGSANNGPAKPPAPKAATSRSPSPPSPAKRPPYDPASTRKFQIEDGRPITIHKHSIRWACPFKSDPEHMTLVCPREGGPLPLRVRYSDFVSWWLRPRV